MRDRMKIKKIVHLVIRNPYEFEAEVKDTVREMQTHNWETEIHYQATSNYGMVYSCLIIARGR